MSATYKPAEVFTPGEYLRDELEERGWTVTEFAEILGRPIQAISEILNGKKEITAETAIDFASALGTSPELWLNLQSAYRLHEVGSDSPEVSPVARRSRLRTFGPIREMQRRGWLEAVDDLDLLEQEVITLFQVESLDVQPEVAFAAKRANAGEPITSGQGAWLAYVKKVARARAVSELDLDRLAALAAVLPGRLRGGPSDLAGLEQVLASHGVVLVIESGLKGSKLDGAALFTDDGVAVVGLTARYDRFDMFVFTLLHELAHLVLGHVDPDDEPLVDEEIGDGTSSSAIERAANDQASEWIFPGGFIAPAPVSTPSIARLADGYGVHPSLVIGRLQRDGTLAWSKLRNHIPKVRAYLEVVG